MHVLACMHWHVCVHLKHAHSLDKHCRDKAYISFQLTYMRCYLCSNCVSVCYSSTVPSRFQQDADVHVQHDLAGGTVSKQFVCLCSFGTISTFAVAGTIISAVSFGTITYLMVLMGIVKRRHLGTAPIIECMLYGECLHWTSYGSRCLCGNAVTAAPIRQYWHA